MQWQRVPTWTTMVITDLVYRLLAELGVKSPLRHSELYKADVRALSKDLGLPTLGEKTNPFACLSLPVFVIR